MGMGGANLKTVNCKLLTKFLFIADKQEFTVIC